MLNFEYNFSSKITLKCEKLSHNKENKSLKKNYCKLEI